MGSFSETTNAVNGAIRTVLGLVLIGGVGYGGYVGYDRFIAPEIESKRQAEKDLSEARDMLSKKVEELTKVNKMVEQQKSTIDEQGETIKVQVAQIEDLGEEIVVLEDTNEQLETSLRLIKVDHRLALIKVLKVGIDEDTGEAFSQVEFVEKKEDGTSIGKPRVYNLKGDEIRVDCWIVKFEDKYIEESSLLRSTSLCVFKSIYGNIDGPTNAYQIEEAYSRPAAYAQGSKLSDFEQKIWDDFWEISSDPKRALELGIRANHGQVNYVKAQEGLVYQIDLRASDGLSIRPISYDGNKDQPAG